MNDDYSRRRFLESAGTLVWLAPAALCASRPVFAADLPLLAETDPAAKALAYVADIKKTKADASHTCSACALYDGAAGSPSGPCKLFPKNSVMAGGSCSAWAPQM